MAQARNNSKAVVRLGEWPPQSGTLVVAKDIGSLPYWFRLFYGRHVLSREWKAMNALRNFPEVPLPLYRPDPDCIVMEFRAGEPAHSLPKGKEMAVLLDRLQVVVQKFHERGITHGDLHRSNILRSEDGSITLIDWATSSIFGASPRGLRRWAFNEFRYLDLRCVAKVKAENSPELLTAEEVEILAGGGTSMYRKIKQVRYGIRRALGREINSKKDYRQLTAQKSKQEK